MSILGAVYTWLAVVFTTASVVLFRVIRLLLVPFVVVLTVTRAYRLLRAAPYVALCVIEGALFWMSSHGSRAHFLALHAHGLWLRELCFMLAVSAFILTGMVLGEVPATLAEIKEANARRWPERRFVDRLTHGVDATFIRQALNLSLIVVPPFVVMWLPWFSTVHAGIVYGAGVWVLAEPFENLEHTNVHNSVFRLKRGSSRGMRLAAWLFDSWTVYVLSPIAGRMPNWYRVQHVGIHHAEDNGEADVQTTFGIDRCSYFAFARSALTWALNAVLAPTIIAYLAKRGGWKRLRMLLANMGAYYVVLGIGAFFNPVAALVVLLIKIVGSPLVVMSYYDWHAFLDPDEPNTYRTSVSISDDESDHGTLGSAFHIEHHLRPARHWSLYAEEFRKASATYAAQKAIVLHPARGTAPIAGLLCRRRFDVLAQRVVSIGDQTDPVWIAEELERRSSTKAPRRSGVVATADRALGGVVGLLM